MNNVEAEDSDNSILILAILHARDSSLIDCLDHCVCKMQSKRKLALGVNMQEFVMNGHWWPSTGHFFQTLSTISFYL